MYASVSASKDFGVTAIFSKQLSWVLLSSIHAVEQQVAVQHTNTPPYSLQIKLIEDGEAAERAVEHIMGFSSLAISCEGLGGQQDDPILLFQVTSYCLCTVISGMS